MFSISIRDASCKRARQELATGDGPTDIATGFDGSWKRRGWTSNESFVSAKSQKTAKVLDVHHFAINCRLCSRHDNMVRKGMMSKMEQLKRLTMHSSSCRQNHNGTFIVIVNYRCSEYFLCGDKRSTYNCLKHRMM